MSRLSLFRLPAAPAGSAEDAVELVIDQREGICRAEHADQDRADEALDHEEQHRRLVFCGRDDPIIKPKGSQDIAAKIPGATLVIYPGMGHNLPEELWPDAVTRITALAGLT
jgi:pimeloyl-ACP methyl ester carboxylesterase